MKNYGFIRTASAVPVVRIADVTYNAAEICRLAGEAFDKEVSLVVFPELSMTGYSCEDLFFQNLLANRFDHSLVSPSSFGQLPCLKDPLPEYPGRVFR